MLRASEVPRRGARCIATESHEVQTTRFLKALQSPSSLLKNSSFDFVLKGRGFKPRRKCHKINPALAAEAAPQTAIPLFQQTGGWPTL